MTEPAIRTVGVIVEWQRVDSPWCDHRWRATGVMAGPAEVAPWTLLAETPELRRYFAGNAELRLYPLETDTLKHNIDGPAPTVIVFLRHAAEPPGIALLGATVCAGEAEAHVDTGTDLVETVPMPPDLAAWVAGFVAEHHVPRDGFKRKRERWGRETDG